jgi:7-cyano-7-deazaguanine reductase
MLLKSSPLGKNSSYPSEYDSSLLFPLPRAEKRYQIGISDQLPFEGMDIWHAYEISWLDAKGKPRVAIGRFIFDASSRYIIESKSLKLYLNSFNCTKFDNHALVLRTIEQDLSKSVDAAVQVELLDLKDEHLFSTPGGICLDDLEIEIFNTLKVDSALLLPSDSLNIVKEKLYSNLFKSNCLVTQQPDWATIFIEYQGRPIDHGALLRYLISYRNHGGFHEQCVERVYMDILKTYSPSYLSVYAKYTRRGGIDISPYRATTIITPPELNRTTRQ